MSRPGAGVAGSSSPPDVHHETIEPWLAGDEPTIACSNCGWSALIGDWASEFTFAIGAPAIVFNNWPMFKEAFVAELRALLGGRTFVVRTHM